MQNETEIITNLKPSSKENNHNSNRNTHTKHMQLNYEI